MRTEFPNATDAKQLPKPAQIVQFYCENARWNLHQRFHSDDEYVVTDQIAPITDDRANWT